MGKVIECKLRHGASFLVEVDEKLDPTGPKTTYRGLQDKATEVFDDAVEKIAPVAELIVSKLGNLSRQPSEVSLEFGIKVQADAALIVAKASGEANFKITIKWKGE